MEIKKYSKKYKFVAYERSRNETHVIVGYAYRWFSDAKSTISQYIIPTLILFENFVMLTEKLIKNKLQLERATQLGYAQPLRSPVGEWVGRPLVTLILLLI